MLFVWGKKIFTEKLSPVNQKLHWSCIFKTPRAARIGINTVVPEIKQPVPKNGTESAENGEFQ